MRPVIGIISNKHVLESGYLAFDSGRINVAAVAEAASCLPLIIPSDPAFATKDDLMARCDGFLFPGGRPNVHPSHYGEQATEAHGSFDTERDALVLPLINALIERGQPLMGICRGFQEINVARGGSLHAEIRELEGRDNHRMSGETQEERFALRHEVRFTSGGIFHDLIGAERAITNSLHGQGINVPGRDVVIDGWAPDGTPEALFIQDAPGFALAVQWHAEWNASQDPVSQKLFSAFGAACRDWQGAR